MSWYQIPEEHPYGLSALPYGIFSVSADAPRVGVRIGDDIVDIAAIAAETAHSLADILATESLNPLMAQGPQVWAETREWVLSLLTDSEHESLVGKHLYPVDRATMQLPIAVADYVDFYASEQHATNVGKIFRPNADALTPNWKHLPIGYHGRSSTVVVSGTDVVRPCGQRKPPDGPPTYGPTQRLDIECELGFIVGQTSSIGGRVGVDEAYEHIFGVVILNDWSSRDLQAWEYVPLGPFLGKSFATSISAWVLPMAALETAKVDLPGQDPAPLGYLAGDGRGLKGLDIDCEVLLNGTVVSRPPYKAMYWSPAQMLAHLSVNGAAVSVGDLFGSGTISGDAADQRGSFLELSWSGERPMTLADGNTRSFLEDGDTVTLRATANAGGTRIALGEVTGTVLPAI